MNNKKRLIISSIMLTIISIIYTLLVKVVDVVTFEPTGTKIGFSSINISVFNKLGTSDFWYSVSKYLIIVPIAFIAFYAIKGLIQLIKRKSLLKVDKEIIALGVFLVVVVITYVFFEKVVINYRPVIIDGELEASFPSSHTLLAACLSLSSVLMNNLYIKGKEGKIANIVLLVSMTLIIVGRLLSGVHWLTDIIGGLLISTTLISYLNLYIKSIEKQ